MRPQIPAVGASAHAETDRMSPSISRYCKCSEAPPSPSLKLRGDEWNERWDSVAPWMKPSPQLQLPDLLKLLGMWLADPHNEAAVVHEAQSVGFCENLPW